MKPYPFKNQPRSNRVYNYRLSRSRRIVENVFGLIANRFRILRNAMLLEPLKVGIIVAAIVCLHNFLMSRHSRHIYAPPGVFDNDTAEGISNGNWREENLPENSFFPLGRNFAHNYSNNSKEIREEFKNYFVSPQGEIPWQYQCI